MARKTDMADGLNVLSDEELQQRLTAGHPAFLASEHERTARCLPDAAETPYSPLMPPLVDLSASFHDLVTEANRRLNAMLGVRALGA